MAKTINQQEDQVQSDSKKTGICLGSSRLGFACKSPALPDRVYCLAHSTLPEDKALFLVLQQERGRKSVAARRLAKEKKRAARVEPIPLSSAQEIRRVLENMLALVKSAPNADVLAVSREVVKLCNSAVSLYRVSELEQQLSELRALVEGLERQPPTPAIIVSSQTKYSEVTE